MHAPGECSIRRSGKDQPRLGDPQPELAIFAGRAAHYEPAYTRKAAAFTTESLIDALPTSVILELVTIYFRKKSEGGLWLEVASFILLSVAPPTVAYWI